MTADRPTRFAVDLLESAAAEGLRQSRSAKQQLDHWARVGRQVSMQSVTAQRRIEAALAGTLPLSMLHAAERVALNAHIDARVQESAGSFGKQLAREGITTVALDDEGKLVRYHPDGTTTVLG
jgi:1-aminocyclopropane-1-carboxylate deaminase/D-cysteine desulfhydrase-like pyridoxal-dependent ACC family enzyme